MKETKVYKANPKRKKVLKRDKKAYIKNLGSVYPTVNKVYSKQFPKYKSK